MMRKWLWSALCLAAPVSARAFDLSADTTRYLADPAFLPLAGQVYGETSFGYRELSEDRTVPGLGTYPHSSVRDTLFGQQLAYGITDRISVSATLNFQESRIKDSYPFGAYDFYAHGFNNPILGATYRAVQQGDIPVSVDIAASYSPDSFAARATSLANGGTTASGGQAAGMQVLVSREMRSLTVQAYGAATYYGEQNRQVSLDNSTTRFGSSWRYDFGLRSQARLFDGFFVDAGAGVSGNTDVTVSDPAEQLAYTGSLAPTLSVQLGAGYHLIPNRLVLSAEYDRDYLGEESMVGMAGAAAKWTNQTENLYAVHLRFLFF